MTAKDIAKKLGISAATVSLALNDRPGVSATTRELVLNEAKACGLLKRRAEQKRRILFLEYRKNNHGGGVSYFDQIFAEVIEGAERAAWFKNCDLTIRTCGSQAFHSDLVQINTESVDGVLVLATEMTADQMRKLEQIQKPILILDNYCENAPLNSVTIDNEQGVELAVQCLIKNGHSKIGYIHIEGNAVNFIERYFAFRRSMELHGLPVTPDRIVRFSTLYGGNETFYQIKKKLEELPDMPTAFFADNDVIAVYAMRALRELDFRVPEDVSIIGFDNISTGKLVDPPLTTIDTSKRNIGECAVNQLTNLMERHLHGIQRVLIQTKLIERGSVKKEEY